MTIGIPRALIHWKRPIFWESFFEALGFKVLLSPNTNKEIVEMGVKSADPETCFSNKVYWGHLLWLERRCDLIFVPRLKTNEEKLEYCPKFFGLPDLAKILVKTSILTPTFDERREKFGKTLEKLGKKLNKPPHQIWCGGKNKKEIKKAVQIALSKEKEIKEKEGQGFYDKIKSKKPKLILISHPYNLYDEYVNLGIREKLEKLGAEPIFIDEVPSKCQMSNVKCQMSGWPNFHWEFGKEIMEKIDGFFNVSKHQNVQISGAIEISAFLCGCDAVLKEFVEREFKKRKTPFLYLMIDENTGEAGFQTRLEAFMDTISV